MRRLIFEEAHRGNHDGCYPGLVLVTPDDWAAACAVDWWSALAG